MKKRILQESKNYELYFLYCESREEIFIYDFELASKLNASEIHQGNLMELLNIIDSDNG